MTRRERKREITREEIKEIARSQMATMGAALLSLNSIAREMEMTTPGLYRYFDSRDALITALIVDAQSSFRTVLESAIALHPADAYGERLLAAMLVYREWAIAHPIDYQLVMCEPIPEYHVPLDLHAVTGTRIFGIFLGLLQAADDAGVLTGATSQPEFGNALKITIPFPMPMGKELSRVVKYQGIVGWYRMHGLVMLELFHHLDHLVSDRATFYRHEIVRLLRGNGFDLAL